MPIIEWTNSIAVNIEQFDQDHKKLIDLINLLHDAMTTGQASHVLSKTIDELIDYTNYHFSSEENIMRKERFHGIVQHIAQHKEFIDKMVDFRKRIENNNLMFSIDLKRYLKDWLVDHILSLDKHLSYYLKNRGYK